MKALILAAGGGTNMAPFSVTRPKPMVHVAGRPVLYRALSTLRESGFSEVYLVTGQNGKAVTDYFGSGQSMNLSITYLQQKKTSGIGDAILTAKSRFVPGEHFLLVYSDVLTDENMAANIQQVFGLTGQPVASICLTKESAAFGNVYLDTAMNITKIVEKPGRKDLGNYVLAGMYILPYSFFGILEKNGGDMAKSLTTLIKAEGLKATIWEKGWLDIACPWDILAANKMIMDSWHSANVHESVKMRDAKIKGPVHIEEDVEIRSGAVIQGPAFIGRGSYIGNNVLIRQYSSLGAESVVGFGVELKNCVLFGRSTVGRLSFIGDSVIGEGVSIGSGTMTINRHMDESTVKVRINRRLVDSNMGKLGAFIGDGAALGSGHTIAPGSVVEAGRTVPHNLTFPKNGR
ncbi:MAG: NTP transferase domain-containing protein [Nitrospinae bacterium]|nr:NTP transferase domain-containing protein [Nitrospinota bacterium]